MRKGTVAIALLLSLPTVLADNLLGRIWDKVISIGNLSFLGVGDSSIVVGFVRLLLAFLVFTIFYAAMANIDFLKDLFKPNQAKVVAGIIAIITAIFLPTQVILGAGGAWALVLAFVMIGGPIVGIGYILFNLTSWMKLEHDTKSTVLIKFLLCMLLFWIFTSIKFHVGRMV